MYKYLLSILLTTLAIAAISCDDVTANKNDNFNIGGETTKPPSGMVAILSKDSIFKMGSNTGYENEKPVHDVKFTYNYFMDSTEVTQSEYDFFMSMYYSFYTTPQWTESYGLGSQFPTYNISWFEAALFCNAKSKYNNLDTVYQYSGLETYESNGKYYKFTEWNIRYSINGYRLPTEAEWEYACKAKDDLNQVTENLNEYSWNKNNSDATSHIVGQKKKNSFGLYDMYGNVLEYCNDLFSSPYPSTEQIDPIGPILEGKWNYLSRGGSWFHDSSYITSTVRNFYYPGGASNSIKGFRTVLKDFN